MTIQKEQTANLLALLEHIRKRPKMYMVKNFPSAGNFLAGFETACKIFGIDIRDHADHNDGIHEAVLQERGWEIRSTVRPFAEMRERGMDDKAITEELLTIAIEVVKRRYLSEDKN
jgi:hypothetical protein